MSNWQTLEVELPAVTKVMKTIAAMKGILEGSAAASEAIGKALELLSPIALLQKGAATLVDKSAIAAAILTVVSSLNKDVVELYPYVPIHESDRGRMPDSLLQLFLDSLAYRHTGSIGAYVPGANSPQTLMTVQEQPEIRELNQLDLGLGTLNRFSGFIIIGTYTDDSWGSVTTYFNTLIQTTVIQQTALLRTTPRSYAFSKLITPVTIPSGMIFAPVWRALKTSRKMARLTRGAQSLKKKIEKLGVSLQQKAKMLRQAVDEIEKLEDLLGLVEDDTRLSVLVFKDLDIKELQSVFFSDGRPKGTESAGFMVIAADPGVSQILELIGV